MSVWVMLLVLLVGIPAIFAAVYVAVMETIYGIGDNASREES